MPCKRSFTKALLYAGTICITGAFTPQPLVGGGIHPKKLIPVSVDAAASEQEDSIQTNESNNFIQAISEKMGQVDESRLLFPEYNNGDCPRMFSAITYIKSEQGDRVRAEHAKGSIAGASALIIGTMVGSGILALPAATVPAGFLPSTAAMFVGWIYMTMSGLLIAELSINRIVQNGRPGGGMLDLYQDILGPKASVLASSAYFFLHYAVLVAYVAQGGNSVERIVVDLFPDLLGGEITSGVGFGQIAFASVCGFWLYTASQTQVSRVNSALVFVLAAAFGGIIAMGCVTADFSSLIDPSNQHLQMIPSVFPIIFLSLAFQNVVPTVVNQLEGDKKKITASIVVGTTVPALLLVLWNAVILGNIQPGDINSANAGLDPVALLQNIDPNNRVLGGLVEIFSSIAIVTTLTGFVYGLLDALTDALHAPREGPDFDDRWKLPLFALIFTPPLVFSLYDPAIFYKALDLGGAFGISTLFLVLPPVMVWTQRYGDDGKPLMTKPMVPFGKLALGSMWKTAGTLIVEQGAEKLGVFEWVGDYMMHK